jgi:hypothetical protein
MRLNELPEIELTTQDTHKTRQMVAMGLLVASISEEPQFHQKNTRTLSSNMVKWGMTTLTRRKRIALVRSRLWQKKKHTNAISFVRESN